MSAFWEVATVSESVTFPDIFVEDDPPDDEDEDEDELPPQLASNKTRLIESKVDEKLLMPF